MPFVNVETQTGSVRYNYTICTPTLNDSSSVIPELPTILFIPSIFTTQVIFHSQFSDPRLRRFNLVTFDIREHGGTVGETTPPAYDQYDSAEDTVRFMEAISLPPCHICGLGCGTTIALQLALSYPERVLSLTLLSPLCLEEVPEVKEGFGEVFECWKSAFPDAETVDEPHLEEAMKGLVQYAFTDLSQSSELVATIAAVMNASSQRKWTFGNLSTCKTMVMDWMLNRKGHTVTELASLRCPVLLVEGDNGVAYPPDYTTRFLKQLEEAGVVVSLVTIPRAPHLLCVDYGDIVDPLLCDLVTSKSTDSSSFFPRFKPAELAQSPWQHQLKEAGWKGLDAAGSEHGDYDDIYLT